MVRVNGKNAAGQSGIKDAQFTEVLDWDPDLAGRLDPKNPDTFPHVLISVPGNDKTGLFKSPIKL